MIYCNVYLLIRKATANMYYKNHLPVISQHQQLLLSILLLVAFSGLAQAFEGIPGLYCGLENCYEVLGANRDSNTDEINKLYRNLAKKWHPDKFQDKDAKVKATEEFRRIATAHEVLKEEGSRNDYNELLDDPEHYYRHYYRYYKRVYGAKVPAHWVILFAISLVSLYQYCAMHLRYKEAIDYFVSVPKYKFQAQDMAKQRGLLPISKRSEKNANTAGKRNRNKSKDEIRVQEEAIIRQVIEENMEISGGCAKPDIKNTLWVQLLLLPVTLYNYLHWYIRWIYLFDMKGELYGEDEKIYLISKHLGVNEEQLYMNEDVDSLLRQEVWKKEKFVTWKKRKDEEMREKLAEKPGYKRYRRYLKKGGAGQITFLDD